MRIFLALDGRGQAPGGDPGTTIGSGADLLRDVAVASGGCKA